MTNVRWILAAAAVTGCATTPEPPPAAEKQAFPIITTAPAVDDPKAYAAKFILATECEEAARKYQSTSADMAWKILVACVDKGNFTAIRRLLDDAWQKDLRTRADAGGLLARVIALRGGDVGGDLKLFRAKKVPVFTLGAAMAQPDTYKGKLVLLRAQVADMRSAGDKATCRLVERTLGAATEDVEVGPKYKSKSSYSAKGEVEVKTTDYGDAEARGSYQSGSEYESVKTEQRHDNVASETGRQALGRLKEADPFLEPGKDFIVLGRFNGVRVSDKAAEDDDKQLGDVSVLSYFEPNALLIE